MYGTGKKAWALMDQIKPFWDDFTQSCTSLESEFVKAGSFVIDPSNALAKLIKEHPEGYYLQDSLDTRRGLRECFRSALALGIIWHQLRYLYRCYSGYTIYRRWGNQDTVQDDPIRVYTSAEITREVERSSQRASQGAASTQEPYTSSVPDKWLTDIWKNPQHDSKQGKTNRRQSSC